MAPLSSSTSTSLRVRPVVSFSALSTQLSLSVPVSLYLSWAYTFDGRHFYIDLVFYNYLMRCFVLIDLKTDDLTHQDLGQMQMYVNYYTRELMNEGDNPPIGIVLCADKSDSIVEYTLPEDNDQVFTAKYLPYLPSKEELARELSAEYRAINEATNGETQG